MQVLRTETLNSKFDRIEIRIKELNLFRQSIIHINSFEDFSSLKLKFIQFFFEIEDDLRESFQSQKSAFLEIKEIKDNLKLIVGRYEALEEKSKNFEQYSKELRNNIGDYLKQIKLKDEKINEYEKIIKNLGKEKKLNESNGFNSKFYFDLNINEKDKDTEKEIGLSNNNNNINYFKDKDQHKDKINFNYINLTEENLNYENNFNNYYNNTNNTNNTNGNNRLYQITQLTDSNNCYENKKTLTENIFNNNTYNKRKIDNNLVSFGNINQNGNSNYNKNDNIEISISDQYINTITIPSLIINHKENKNQNFNRSHSHKKESKEKLNYNQKNNIISERENTKKIINEYIKNQLNFNYNYTEEDFLNCNKINNNYNNNDEDNYNHNYSKNSQYLDNEKLREIKSGLSSPTISIQNSSAINFNSKSYLNSSKSKYEDIKDLNSEEKKNQDDQKNNNNKNNKILIENNYNNNNKVDNINIYSNSINDNNNDKDKDSKFFESKKSDINKKADRILDIVLKIRTKEDISDIISHLFGDNVLDLILSPNADEELIEKVKTTIKEIERLIKKGL
jgi:hypothetical protein